MDFTEQLDAEEKYLLGCIGLGVFLGLGLIAQHHGGIIRKEMQQYTFTIIM